MHWCKTHTFWTNLATWFTQILPKQNTDFLHFIYWTNILNWPLNLALLHGKKEALPCQSIDRAHWSNALMSAANTSMQQSSSIDSALIQCHTGIVILTALWSNVIQASSDWQCSDPMSYRHHQIDSALIQWHTVIVRLTVLWSNVIQASSDWQRSNPMAYSHC